ncbi:MAG TPA: DsrE family protein, partial [Fimbriimonadaceae bacterium]|nr:DsrE family protein [Fimbriimonadaceae bacterium]
IKREAMLPIAFVPLLLTGAGLQHIHRAVFEFTGMGIGAEAKVLGNAANLIKAFKDEKVELEIVCHDDGIDLLLTRSGPIRTRLDKLHGQGVVLAACGNTIRGRNIDRKHLIPYAVVVDSGVAEVVRKEEAGWSYVRSAY